MQRPIAISFLFSTILFIFSCRNTPNIPELETQSLLQAYVNAPDSSYRFELRNTIEGPGYTAYVLYLQSQRWLTENEVKDPLWWHWLTIVVPDVVQGNTGLLSIGGGSRNRTLPQEVDPIAVQVAITTQSITADLHNIPNQPVEFVGDPKGPRVEDGLIAYGWKQFMDRGAKDEDAEWLARLPMTKAAVRAMDAATDFCKENGHTLDKYVVLGGSKRGWTTWTTAVVDDRVVAIAPAVIDMLNVIPSFEHHWQAYGFWAPAVGDYVEEGIMDRQGDPTYEKLVSLVEPYAFREQLDLPKFIINATGDQFFLPDSWQFYWNDLVGEKYLRYVPNTEHSLGGSDALQSFTAFYHSILNKQARPEFDWEVDSATFTLSIDPAWTPSAVRLWKASNPTQRDFRVETIGKAYKKTDIAIASDGKYSLPISTPDEGWSAYFVELEFPSGGPIPFTFSTGVKVVPEALPFPPLGE